MVDHRKLLAVMVAYLATMHDQLRRVAQNIKQEVEFAFFLGDTAELYHQERAQGISGALLGFVVVGLVILLGILIYSEIQQSLPTPSNADLSNASSNATASFSDSMELAPLVVLVGVSAVILAVVQRFRA